MIKVAYLSMDSLDDFECYDYLTFEPMSSLGHSVTEVSWKSKVDWNNFDYVIIRSPWDYQDNSDEFLLVLDSIENSSAILLNPINIIKWNINKIYLRDLEQRGVAIVPTTFFDGLDEDSLETALKTLDYDEFILKPTISANADHTYRVSKDNKSTFIEQKLSIFSNRQCMLQPFIDSVVNEGEYSLFYFNGDLSHCILKTPESGDFRVQEEHGGKLKRIDKPEADLIESGDIVLNAITQDLLYARLDFVRFNNSYVLMEAELIEPSLYFNLEPESPIRFANAFHNLHKKLTQ